MPKDQPSQQPQLLSADAVAQLLMVHKRTVWRMTDEGALPQPVRVRNSNGAVRATRWRRRDLELWIESLSDDQESS